MPFDTKIWVLTTAIVGHVPDAVMTVTPRVTLDDPFGLAAAPGGSTSYWAALQ
jgi:hypothetical protein